MEKWIKIRYDYLPKYCTTCMIQGHNVDQCFMEHPELFNKKEQDNKGRSNRRKIQMRENKGRKMQQRIRILIKGRTKRRKNL